ncbi:MAG: hypothetical protein LBV74_05010 [Tannerella sp.]|jgi:hypothetical protein|nr:hypothetical protein [Tannerella sp.]
MNKVKSVLAVALVFAISAPCFGNSVVIKRKKNKWLHSMEQKSLNDTDNNNQEITGSVNF